MAGRQADVVGPAAGGEGMHGLVDPPGASGRSRSASITSSSNCLLPVERELAVGRRRRRSPRSAIACDERHLLAPSAARRPRAPRPSSCRARSRRAGCRTARRRRRSSRRSGAAARSRCGGAAGTTAKSEFWRASTQTGSASDEERVSSARRSDGTRRAFSQSCRVTRIRLASTESYGCDSSKPCRSSSSRPTSGAVNFSCAIRPSVASCSARPAAPRGRHLRLLVPGEDARRLGDVPDLGEPLASART